MLGKNYYHRSFIILQSKDRGYGFKEGKEPAGYCKLEIKKDRGRAYVYVQDIREADDIGGIYEVILISNKSQQQPQSLGILDINNRGRGENIIEFDPLDVGGSGRALDEFHAMAIALIRQDNQGELLVKFPLVGYSDRRIEIDWTGRVAPAIAETMASRVQERSEEVEDVAKEQKMLVQEQGEERELVRESEEEVVEEETVEEEIVEEEIGEEEIGEEEIEAKETAEEENVGKRTVEEENAEGGIVIAAEEDGEERAVEAEMEVEEAAEEEIVEEESIEEHVVDEVDMVEKVTEREIIDEEQRRLESIIQSQYHRDEEVEENKKDQEKVVNEVHTKAEDDEIKLDVHEDIYWNKVEGYFNGLMNSHNPIDPFDEYIANSRWIKVPQYGSYYPYSHNNHYIIGLISEGERMKYIVYGIPGPYGPVPPQGMDGFYCWKPGKDMYGFGYWLLFIDASTGEVVYPY